MKVFKKTLAVVLAAITVFCTGITAFAAKTYDGAYSITWVFEDRTEVDWYDEGETIVVRDAILSDGSVGGWSTNADADCAPMESPVPNTMPAEDLTFYAKKNWVSAYVGGITGAIFRLTQQYLSKDYWKEKSPVFWVFPYIWNHIVYAFAILRVLIESRF